MKAPKTILKINKVLDSSIVLESDCGEKTQKTVIGFLSSATGKLKASHLSRMLENEYGVGVKFSGSIEVKELKDFLADKLNLKETIITKVSSLYGQASLNLNGGELISAECAQCSNPGERNIKLKVDKQSLWLSADLKVKRSGYRLVKEVSPFTRDFGPEYVEPALSLDDGKAAMFKDLERLRFFKPNKPLAKGQTLKQSDLVPRTLVKFNQGVEVLVQGKNISLKTKGVSRQNGKHGDTITLVNAKTGKKMTGRVIDFNTVAVEL